MNFKILIGITLLVAGYFYFSGPSLQSIAKGMKVEWEEGTITSNGTTYYADWGEPVKYTGDLRYFGRASNSDAPFFTHDSVVTSGEYSDEEKVFVSPIRDGNMYYRFLGSNEIEGSLIVLHFIPTSFAVFEKLDKLKQGNEVTLIGREEEDSLIEDDLGVVVGLRHNNHRFFLLEDVRLTE